MRSFRSSFRLQRVRLRRFKLRRGPLPFRYVLIISFVLFIVFTLQGLWIVNKSIQPTLLSYAEVQLQKLATVIITKAVEDHAGSSLDTEKMIDVKYDKNGKVSSVNVDTKIANKVMASTIKTMEEYLHEAEKGNTEKLGISETAEVNLAKGLIEDGILFTVPLGQITNNAILGNLGPHIPVSFSTIGHATGHVKEKIEPYGINNAMVQVVMEVEVVLKVIIPFETKETVVKTEVPLMIKAIQGDVPSIPSYFNNGASND